MCQYIVKSTVYLILLYINIIFCYFLFSFNFTYKYKVHYPVPRECPQPKIGVPFARL